MGDRSRESSANLLPIANRLSPAFLPIRYRAIAPTQVWRLPELPGLRLGQLLVEVDSYARCVGYREHGSGQPRLHREQQVGVVDARLAVVQILGLADAHLQPLEVGHGRG